MVSYEILENICQEVRALKEYSIVVNFALQNLRNIVWLLDITFLLDGFRRSSADKYECDSVDPRNTSYGIKKNPDWLDWITKQARFQ